LTCCAQHNVIMIFSQKSSNDVIPFLVCSVSSTSILTQTDNYSTESYGNRGKTEQLRDAI